MIAWRKRVGVLSWIVLICAVGIVLLVVRRPIVRAVGRVLVVNDSIEPVDIIVVALGANDPGVLEAADLVHGGVANRVAVFAVPPNRALASEFARRGGAYEDPGARTVRQLRSLGIEIADSMPRYVNGTEDEGPALAEWCEQQGFRSVVVVSASDHSRRLRRVLDRSIKGHNTNVRVRSARYSNFDPDRWWETRDGIRTEVGEFEKLLLDIVRHPIS